MAKKSKLKISGLKYPAADKIGSRTSTIARSMASSIVPRIPAEPEDEEVMNRFFEKDDELCCAYCGAKATHLDHLHPLVNDKILTGYYTEPHNLVPCCGTCNQKKGKLEWGEYMKKNEREGGPICAKNVNKQELMEKLIEFIKQHPAHKINITDEIKAIWEEYDKICEQLEGVQDKVDEYLENSPDYSVEESCDKVTAEVKIKEFRNNYKPKKKYENSKQ